MAITDQDVNERWAIYNGDCMEVMATIPDDRIHLSIYSPPFGGLYTYSSSERDLSNCLDKDEFFEHYEYVVRELARITLPGRITAVHSSDITLSNTGKDKIWDLPGDIIRLHERCKLDFICRHVIWKEPLWVRNRTMTKNLSHRTACVDAVYCGEAMADQILIFRKRGANPTPVEHPTGLTYYAGESPVPIEFAGWRNFNGDQKQNRYSHWIWRQYASSVWDDVRWNRVLPFMDCKEKDDEKHVHPLQLDIIDRVIVLRSNPGEVVFTPFMGVGSEVFSAVRLGRRGMGVELKPSYYRQALANLRAVDREEMEARREELPLDDMD